MDPFASYIGKAVRLRGKDCLVEASEVHGAELLFRLVEQGSGKRCFVDAVQLIELEERFAQAHAATS